MYVYIKSIKLPTMFDIALNRLQSLIWHKSNQPTNQPNKQTNKQKPQH